MRNLLSLMGVTLLSLVFGGVANAQLMTYDVFSGGEALNAGSYAKLLNEYDSNRWYSEFDVIEWSIDWDALTVQSPVLIDDYVDNVPVYRLILSPYRVSALSSLDADVDVSSIITRDINLEWDSKTVSATFSLEDIGLDPEKWYYGVVAPISDLEIIWIPSKEFCFQSSSRTFKWDRECDDFELINNMPSVDEQQWNDAEDLWETMVVNDDNTSDNEEHGAAGCVWMDLANVSHKVNGDKIILTWTAVAGDSVQIAIFDPEEEVYKSLWTANMSDEKFSYKMQWNGEQNFMLTNGCREVYYKADGAVKAEPTIVPAATGPAENVMYIVIATIILYGAYVAFFRKADNK